MNEFRDSLPSAEHRGHIRRFLDSGYADKEDVALRGFVFWKRLNARLLALALAVKKPSTNRSGRR